MEHRFRLQDSWLGCNGVVSAFAVALAFALAAIACTVAAYLALARRSP